MSDEGFKALQVQARELGQAFWACRSCLSFAVKMNSQMRVVTKQVEELKEKVEENTKLIQGNADSVEDVKKSVVNLDEKVEDMEKRIEARIYGEMRERESRKASVVMHGLEEPPPTIKDGKERAEDDFARALEVMKTAKADLGRKDMIYCWRMGEKGEDPRPLVLGLESKAARLHLLNQAKELKNSEYKHVHIVPYLTKKQMQEEADMEKEAEGRNKNLSEADKAKNWEWMVRGKKGEKRLVKGLKRETQLSSQPTTGANRTRIGGRQEAVRRKDTYGQGGKRGRGSSSENEVDMLEERRASKTRK